MMIWILWPPKLDMIENTRQDDSPTSTELSTYANDVSCNLYMIPDKTVCRKFSMCIGLDPRISSPNLANSLHDFSVLFPYHSHYCIKVLPEAPRFKSSS